MRLLFFGDMHFCEYASIYRKMGQFFSKRLENLINTQNKIEATAEEYRCDMVIGCGDYFDKPELNATEITALQEIGWSNIPHAFIVGNHEGLLNNLSTSSAHLFRSIPNFTLYDKPDYIKVDEDTYLLFLPYCLECDRQSLLNTFPFLSDLLKENKKIIIVSHNDIKGLQYGGFESKDGYDIEDIEQHCTLFINGHLHNGSKFCNNGYNIGNITGQNFSENAFKYKHRMMLVDTDTMSIEYIENDWALNFYKFEVFDSRSLHNSMNKIQTNSVVTIKAPEDLIPEVKQLLNENTNIVEHRVLMIPKVVGDSSEDTTSVELNSINHLEQFITYIKDTMDMSDLLLSELLEVCK